MQIGMIGLGRMGARLFRDQHGCVAHDQPSESTARVVATDAAGAASLGQFDDALKAPRAVWLMVPAAAVDKLLEQLTPLLKAGDILIDGGNSHHHDDPRRAEALAASGIAHVDVGTSGGVADLERGYCLMIGGSQESVQHLATVFATLAPGSGTAVPTPVLSPALHARFSSRGDADFANRVLSGVRHEFGGHADIPRPGQPPADVGQRNPEPA